MVWYSIQSKSHICALLATTYFDRYASVGYQYRHYGSITRMPFKRRDSLFRYLCYNDVVFFCCIWWLLFIESWWLSSIRVGCSLSLFGIFFFYYYYYSFFVFFVTGSITRRFSRVVSTITIVTTPNVERYFRIGCFSGWRPSRTGSFIFMDNCYPSIPTKKKQK